MQETQESLMKKTNQVAIYVGRPCQIGKGSEYSIYILLLEEIDMCIIFICSVFISSICKT